MSGPSSSPRGEHPGSRPAAFETELVLDGEQLLHATETATSTTDAKGAEQLLRDTDTYLAAIHQHAHLHDRLGANFACEGCELRARIRDHLNQ